MQLRLYLAMLWGNKWIILVTLLTTLGVVVIGTLLTTPMYVSTATLRVATSAGGAASYSDYMYADRLMNTYAKIATSRPIQEELSQRLGNVKPPKILVQILPNTELIKISAESSNPQVAQQSANILSEILVDQGREFYSGGGKSPQEILNSQLAIAEDELAQARKEYENLVSQNRGSNDEVEAASRMIQLREKTYATLLEQYDQARLKEEIRANIISIVEPAELPSWYVRPRPLVNLVLAVLVGLSGGVGLALLFEHLRPRVYTSSQIEAITGMTLLGKIPKVESEFLAPSVNGSIPMDSPIREAFRHLRTSLFSQSSDSAAGNQLRSLAITSAEPGEGKTTISTQLALSMIQSGKRVILIDTDMRIPRLHTLLELPNVKGLSNVLRRSTSLDQAIQVSRIPGLNVITSGPTPSNPTELLASPVMKVVLNELMNRYDIVLMDTPAFLPVADVAVLAPMVDGIVVVVRRSYIRQDAIREMCKQLGKIKARKFGVVVNAAEANGHYYYYKAKQ